MAYRHRVLENRLKKRLGLFPAVAITDPRQSGKSTLQRAALPDFPYVSLDDPEEVQAAERDPRGFLSRRLSESLAGRIGLLELHPFERWEMPRAARAGQILRGSYPELTMRNHEGTCKWYASYLATYLERDVRLANDVGKLLDFQTLVRLIAIRTSQEYNASARARDVGVSSKTVESWVSILEASYLVFRLRPWQANIGKRLVKRPKLFFWDTGLVCHLSGIRAEDALEEGPLGGPVRENLVIAEVLKAAAHRGLDVEAHYFRESNGLESDLLIRDRERGEALDHRRKIQPYGHGSLDREPWPRRGPGQKNRAIERVAAGWSSIAVPRSATGRSRGAIFSVSKTRLTNDRRRHGRCTISVHLPRSVS